MAEAPLEVFAPLAQQRLAARALGRPLGAAQGRTMFLTQLLRVSSPGLRIGDDGAHGALLELRNLLEGKAAFIPPELAAELFQGASGATSLRVATASMTRSQRLGSWSAASPGRTWAVRIAPLSRSLTCSGLSIMSHAPSLVRPTLASTSCGFCQ